MSGRHRRRTSTGPGPVEVGLLTGGSDKPYAFGLAMALLSKGVRLDFIGSDDVDSPELHTNPNLTFLKLRGDQTPDASFAAKTWRILLYYARLIRYVSTARPGILHILWNNRFQTFDRTVLMLYYKLQRKRLALTAHNVNAARRDGHDSWLNRITLRIQYRLADHIFVHTDKMKTELLADFGVPERDVTVVPFGINNAVPHTSLTPAEAKRRLGLEPGTQTVLFFGRIAPYKGLDLLVAAVERLATARPRLRLIIAGKAANQGYEGYVDTVRQAIVSSAIRDRVIERIEFIPDADTEVYFKAADALVLPYTEVFQSGVLFLAYSFGLPVIATSVGSFSDDIVEGQTGYLARSSDPADLAAAIDTYFSSDLFENLDSRRVRIANDANARHSWDEVGDRTVDVYAHLQQQPCSSNIHAPGPVARSS
jgi:glycosyltransferase involved in cell wall biosynthesis